MAIAEKALSAQFNAVDYRIIDHHTYVFMGDGCLMEGISHEACSLAGTLGLGKLIVFWDDNGISIDGEVEGWFTDDTPKRFESYGWQVIADVDGHDPSSIHQAIELAKTNSAQPTLICCKTIIGKGSPNKQGKEECHGAPLGEDELAAVRESLSWEHPPFFVPETVLEAWDARKIGHQRQQQWQAMFDEYKVSHPASAKELLRRINGELPKEWHAKTKQLIAEVDEQAQTIASRKASLNALNLIGPLLPELLGGSADLAGSNYTIHSESKSISAAEPGENYLHYGVREFGMAAIANGLGGLRWVSSLWRYFLGVCRLYEERNANVGTNEAAGDLCVDS